MNMVSCLCLLQLSTACHFKTINWLLANYFFFTQMLRFAKKREVGSIACHVNIIFVYMYILWIIQKILKGLFCVNVLANKLLNIGLKLSVIKYNITHNQFLLPITL